MRYGSNPFDNTQPKHRKHGDTNESRIIKTSSRHHLRDAFVKSAQCGNGYNIKATASMFLNSGVRGQLVFISETKTERYDMFTLKFKNFSDEGESTTCISCAHYSVWRSKSVSDFIEVTVYKDFTSQDGVTYNVGQVKGKPYFDVCFVENQNGKTIDRIGF